MRLAWPPSRYWAAIVSILVAGEVVPSPEVDTKLQDFPAGYWQRPLAPQGPAPAGLSPLEASLDPESCRACHPEQFAAWSGSRHAQAMGAGVMGQLLDISKEERQACLDCHAPLAEQAESLETGIRHGTPQASSASLHGSGVSCAVCHLRHYQWHGPPRRADLPPPGLGQPLPHGGWHSQPAFENSVFCAACHQFPPQGNAVNGKLLEDTYREWQASPQAREGKHCQTCHMPGRRHEFRGIHDPDMTSAAVKIEIAGPRLEAGGLQASLTLTNTGAAHRLPTYATPRLILAVFQIGAEGKPLDGSLVETVIGWSVSLDLTQEWADTRLAPEQTAVLRYQRPLLADATQVAFQVRVEPEHFYTRFYQALLEQRLTDKGEGLIRQALEASLATRYLLFQERRGWPPGFSNTRPNVR